MTHINGNDVNNNNNNNDVNNNNSIDNNTIRSENIIHKNAIHKKRIKQYFNTFVNLLDSRSDYYILNAYMNSAKRSLTPAATRYIAKNADHVLLPLPRDNPEKMYEKIDDTLEKIGMGEPGETNKLEKINDKTIDVITTNNDLHSQMIDDETLITNTSTLYDEIDDRQKS